MIIQAVGLGPGDLAHITPCALSAIENCDVLVGYSGYIKLIKEKASGKEIISTGMKGEIKRCIAAIEEAKKGKRVCIVSSGDAGIYGMASLLYELSELEENIDIEVIPGITAAISAAAILGSPLSNDFAVISLSDLLTPWDVIERRLKACSAADMVLCLYNPGSINRSDHLQHACDIVMEHRSVNTHCGYVRNAYRGKDQESLICSLEELAVTKVDMFTIVIIGNSCTKLIDGKLVTSRGYELGNEK